jgi:rare lipoprotein A
VTLLADRYAGRHIRQARHGAWVNKKRSRTNTPRQLLPAAAALTVAGILLGGAGAVIQFSGVGPGTNGAGTDLAAGYDPADYPPADRSAQANRASREDVRTTEAPTTEVPATVAPTTPPAAVTTGPAAKATTTAPKTLSNAGVASTGTCQASFYDEPQETANGETFNPDALTAAHKTLPFNTQVRVTNQANGKSVIVRINDRGPYVSGRCLDLSRAAFATIASTSAGVANVKYEVLVPDAT